MGTSKRGAQPDVSFLPGGRSDLKAQTMEQLISAAWDLDDERLSGGPGRMKTDHFDIVAKANTQDKEATLKLMSDNALHSSQCPE